jgi:hypothetical protein
MFTPDSIESQVTLQTAVARYDQLRTRDSLADLGGPPDPETGEPSPLSRDEALELLALGEVIARKAGYGRQLAVRSARAAGASWSQIGGALGTSKQTAWEMHNRWIDQQARHDDSGGGTEDLAATFAAQARALAGKPDEDEA